MKKFYKILATLLGLLMVAMIGIFASCEKPSQVDQPKAEINYADQLKLDLNSETKKQEVTVRLYIDGDTTHFDPVRNSQITGYNANDFVKTQGYIKARYLAINTPECTGKIEPWGKAAATFTRSKLETATTIIVESDTAHWDLDSTGERYTLWIWYMPQGQTEYRNLNLEILQAGLALGSSTSSNRYGEICMNALEQAEAFEHYVFSKEKDPDYHYGNAIHVTLKELRCNIAKYNNGTVDNPGKGIDGTKVRVEGVVVADYGNSVYVEEYDEEAGVCFGMAVYYSFTKGELLNILSIGNRVSICGYVSYWEGGGTYQISGLSYNKFEKDNPDNTLKISEGNTPRFETITGSQLTTDKLTVSFEAEDENGAPKLENVTLSYGEAIMNTSVVMENLQVVSIYTTNNGGVNDGAMSITCRTEDGKSIVVRTAVLKENNGTLITQEKYAGKKISVKGVVDQYNGAYQIFSYMPSFITILD